MASAGAAAASALDCQMLAAIAGTITQEKNDPRRFMLSGSPLLFQVLPYVIYPTRFSFSW
jgi:hypothetical protein